MSRFPPAATALHYVALGLLCGFILSALATATAADQDAPPKPGALIIDYGDGVQKHFVELKWPKGSSVLDVMRLAAKHRRGIQFKFQGQGATALLVSIDRLSNEGRGRNWIYRVNGKLADKSFGLYTVQPTDTILWSFSASR